MWEESDKRLVRPCCELGLHFPGGFATTAQKATSRLADGMERAETIWPEVTGADMVDAGVQVFVDRMTLVHRRIVGRWICQRVEARPFSIVMPVVGRMVMCETGSNPDFL